jgi:hypothetical protein
MTKITNSGNQWPIGTKNEQNGQSDQNVNNDQNQWKVNVTAVLGVCLAWLYLS